MNGFGKTIWNRGKIMNPQEALKTIKKIWESKEERLGDKIIKISDCFSAADLEIIPTACYINATPSELEAFLALRDLDDEILEMLSEINPPNTTWTLIANANEEEIRSSLNLWKYAKDRDDDGIPTFMIPSEYIYDSMSSVSKPTADKGIILLSGKDIEHALKKGKAFKELSEYDEKFLKNIARRKQKCQMLTDKQKDYLVTVLNNLADKKIISRDSIDDDRNIDVMLLESIGR